jgi:predicted nuclease of restriction endonuclease-like (RecB) superfamily
MAKNNYLTNSEYKHFIENIKINIKRARQVAVLKVNSELINLYYNLGKEIVLKQQKSNWGDDLIGQIERDLKKEFPGISGFSRRNLFYMKNFYTFFGQKEKVPQLVAQIPWSHTRVILDKTKNVNEALFYINESIANNWSRVILEHQIELKLYERKGKMMSNFSSTLAKKDVKVVTETFKEDYFLDFLNVKNEIKEKCLEDAIINNIIQFLMELGKGFAFVGRQYKVIVGGDEFFLDLLFYNYILKRFVVVELKTINFKPEHAGQLGFYMTVVDKEVKQDDDKETIGLLICKSKNKTVVEYALSGNKKPLGVAEYKFLPGVKELEEVV